MINDYRIERLTNIEQLSMDDLHYISTRVYQLAKQYGNVTEGRFPLEWAAKNGVIFLCRRKGQICGWVYATLFPDLFNPGKFVLRQELLFAESGSRASWYLINEFLDFGKRHANYVITMIGAHTNLTPRNLKRLGFKELETLYRLEVERESI